MKFALLCASVEIEDRRHRRKQIRSIPLDKYVRNTTELISKVDDAEVEIGEKGIPEVPKLERDPILNFKFINKGSIIDFSDEPMISSFKEYLNNTKKRQWLQKCLNLGLPLYTSLPLKEIGFRIQWII